jgi:hypothetical protein
MKSRLRTSTLNHAVQGVLLGVKKINGNGRLWGKKNLENMRRAGKLVEKTTTIQSDLYWTEKQSKKCGEKNEFLEQTEPQKMGSS